MQGESGSLALKTRRAGCSAQIERNGRSNLPIMTVHA